MTDLYAELQAARARGDHESVSRLKARIRSQLETTAAGRLPENTDGPRAETRSTP